MPDRLALRVLRTFALAASVALAAGVVLGTSAAVAQDASPGPGEAAGIFVPETVAGRTLEVTELSGASFMTLSDPEDPDQASALEDLNTILASVGAAPEQMLFLSGFANDDEGNVVILAVRLEGADSDAFMEPWLDWIASPNYEELEFASGEFGGKQVTVLTDAGYPFDDPPKSFGYGFDDTVWLIGGTEEWAVEALEALP